MSELYTQEQKDQFFELLATYPDEVAGLRAALVEGRLNGMSYQDSYGCGCVLGTIAMLRHVSEVDILFYPINDYDEDAEEDEEYSPIERLVMAIKRGDTPATNPVSALLVGWIDSHALLISDEDG